MKINTFRKPANRLLVALLGVGLAAALPVAAERVKQTPQGKQWPMKYEDGWGTGSVLRGTKLKVTVGSDCILVGTKQGVTFSIPVTRVIEVAYDIRVRRRGGQWAELWVGAARQAVLSSGDGFSALFPLLIAGVGGAVLAPIKTRKHFVHIVWQEEGVEKELRFKVGKGEYAAFLAELERVTGRPWKNLPQQRATQIARSAPPPTSSGFPNDPLPLEDDSEPVPDFREDASAESEPPESTTVGTDRELLAPPAAPEPPPSVWEDPNLGDPDGYKLKVDVRLVMLDAVVRGRSGRPLDNLTREDFRLFEDGVEQRIRHFSRDELPLAVALVVDRSSSVAPYMRELRLAGYQTLSQLKRRDQVALFAFASNVRRLEDLTSDRQRIADRIARIRPGGGTNIIDALFDATYYLSAAAPDRRKAIILISDNQATTKAQTSQGQIIRMALESETVVYSIKTPGERTPLTMRLPTWLGEAGSVHKITGETGGEVIDIRRARSLQAALAAVISRLKLRYTLGYQSANKTHDGAFRKIDVRLTHRFGQPDRDYSVHARHGYYGPTETVASKSLPPRGHRAAQYLPGALREKCRRELKQKQEKLQQTMKRGKEKNVSVPVERPVQVKENALRPGRYHESVGPDEVYFRRRVRILKHRERRRALLRCPAEGEDKEDCGHRFLKDRVRKW
ncbi:MAG: VWA domain-containing protein [Candidatus Acidiferrales bacterium]